MSNITNEITFSKVTLENVNLTMKDISNINVNSIDLKSLNFSDIIVQNIDLTMNNNSANVNGYYSPVNQSEYQGSFITQIGLSVAEEGKITIFFIENINTNQARIALQREITVKKEQQWYDINCYLATTMSIAICQPNSNEATFYYTNSSSEKFYYSSGSLKSWVIAPGNLNIGIKIRNINNIHHSLKNKKISIIGDSISTLYEYNSGNNGRYPTGDVKNAVDTWWMQLILQTGAKLVQNNSIGGTAVTQRGVGETNNLQKRLKTIPSETDICFIAMGTNDLGSGCEFRTFNPHQQTFDITNFTDAVCNAIITLQQNYPTTKFIWITPMKRFDGTTGEQPYTKNNQTIQSYTNRLIEICDFYGWEYINMTNLGINYINQSKYFADGLHPNKAGMYLMADYIKNSYK